MEPPKVTCDDVNALVSMCSISQEKAITSLKQCSSSLFVLLYQRLFNCAIKGIDSSPYTLEQKKWNVGCVLNELRDKRGIDVTGIDAEEIVQLNEEHISRLIMLFLDIAYRMKLQGGVGAGSSASLGAGMMGGSALLSLSATAQRPVLAELQQESVEDGTWYVPVGSMEGRMLHTQHMNSMHALHDPMKAAGATQHVDTERLKHQQHPIASSHFDRHHHTYSTSREVMARGEEEEDEEEDVVVARMHANNVGEADVFPCEEGGGEGIEHHVKVEHEDGGSAGSYSNIEEEGIPTTQLVKAWNAEVIPPEHLSYVVDSVELADVRERLNMMDERLMEVARERENRRRKQRSALRQAPAVTTGAAFVGDISSGIDHPSGGGVTSESKGRRKGGIALPRSLVPETICNDDMLYNQPKRMINYTLRNEKIEMLRSLRFIDDLQKDIRRKMVQQHNDATRKLREEVRQALEQDRREKLERERQIRDEDKKYRSAYRAIMAAACNDARIAKDLMMDRTRQLAEYQSLSLRENRRMCQYMKRESRERMRHDLLRYASTVTGWQSQFVI